MQRHRRKKAGRVNYRLINGDSDEADDAEAVSCPDLHEYLAELATSARCHLIDALPKHRASGWSLDEALLSPLLIRRETVTQEFRCLSASHPVGIDLLANIDGQRTEVQLASASGLAPGTFSYQQWLQHIKRASDLHEDAPRPLKRLCKAGDVGASSHLADTDATPIAAILTSLMPLYATLDVLHKDGFAVPTAVSARSAAPTENVAPSFELQPTMQAVCAMPAAASDFSVHPSGAACWWQQVNGQRLILAAPPLASNLGACIGRRNGEMWGGPLGGQMRGLVAAKLEAGDSLFLPAGWVVAHVAIPRPGDISRGTHGSNIALMGHWQPRASIEAQLSTWQAQGGLEMQSAQSQAFLDLMWRTAVAARCRLKAVSKLPFAMLSSRADDKAEQRAAISAATSAVLAAADKAIQARREEAAAARRQKLEAALAQQKAADEKQLLSPQPRSRRRKAQRPHSAAAPSDALPFSSSQHLQHPVPATKLKIRVGGTAIGAQLSRTTPRQSRQHVPVSHSGSASDVESSMSGEATWRHLRDPPPKPIKAHLSHKPLLQHQVRTRGGRVASRAMVAFEDVHSEASSAASVDTGGTGSSSTESVPLAPLSHTHWMEGTSTSTPRVPGCIRTLLRTIPQVDGANDSNEDSERSNGRHTPDEAAAESPLRQQAAIAPQGVLLSQPPPVPAAGTSPAKSQAHHVSGEQQQAPQKETEPVSQLSATHHLPATTSASVGHGVLSIGTGHTADSARQEARQMRMEAAQCTAQTDTHLASMHASANAQATGPVQTDAQLADVQVSTAAQQPEPILSAEEGSGTRSPHVTPPLAPEQQTQPLPCAPRDQQASAMSEAEAVGPTSTVGFHGDAASAAVQADKAVAQPTDVPLQSSAPVAVAAVGEFTVAGASPSNDGEQATTHDRASAVSPAPPRVLHPGTSMHKSVVEGIEIVPVQRKRLTVNFPKPRLSMPAGHLQGAHQPTFAKGSNPATPQMHGQPASNQGSASRASTAPDATGRGNNAQASGMVSHSDDKQPYDHDRHQLPADQREVSPKDRQSLSRDDVHMQPSRRHQGLAPDVESDQPAAAQQPIETGKPPVKAENNLASDQGDSRDDNAAGGPSTTAAAPEAAPTFSKPHPAAEGAVVKQQTLGEGDRAETSPANLHTMDDDDVSRWQACRPSWLPSTGHAYERDAPGLAALLAALQNWVHAEVPPPSFIRHAQRLVDELAVCIDAADVAVPQPQQHAHNHSKQSRKPQRARDHDLARAADVSDNDYAAPSRHMSYTSGGSDASSGSRGHRSHCGSRAALAGASLRRLKRPHSGVLSLVGSEEAADSAIEARAQGRMQAGRHSGLPGLAGLTAKKSSVKSRLMKKLRLQ